MFFYKDTVLNGWIRRPCTYPCLEQIFYLGSWPFSTSSRITLLLIYDKWTSAFIIVYLWALEKGRSLSKRISKWTSLDSYWNAAFRWRRPSMSLAFLIDCPNQRRPIIVIMDDCKRWSSVRTTAEGWGRRRYTEGARPIRSSFQGPSLSECINSEVCVTFRSSRSFQQNEDIVWLNEINGEETESLTERTKCRKRWNNFAWSCIQALVQGNRHPDCTMLINLRMM